MTKDDLDVLVILIGCPILLVLLFIYFSYSKSTSCYLCGTQVNHRKNARYWKRINGENRALCKSCYSVKQKTTFNSTSVPEINTTDEIKDSGLLETSEVVEHIRDGDLQELPNEVMADDLESIIAKLSNEQEPLARHFLFQEIVENAYKHRADDRQRSLFIHYAEMHVDEFDKIVPDLKEKFGDSPKAITFQYLATILTEDGYFQKAVDICDLALKYGLHDGTKTGYKGRIKRIQRKANQTKKNRIQMALKSRLSSSAGHH